MGWHIKGDVRTAVMTLRRNKGRSLLTMLGIIIGVTAVVTVVSIGEGVKSQITDQTEHLGKDLITIRPGQLLHSSGTLASFTQPFAITGGQLNEADVAVVTRTDGVAAAAPLSIVSGGVTSGENSQHFNVPVIGTNSKLPGILNQDIAYGAFFGDDATGADKVVIGSQIAHALFDENVPLGQTVSILGHQFIVVGIFSDFQTIPLSLDTDFNNAVFIQYAASREITNNDAPLYEILARPTRVSQTDMAIGRLNGSLLTAHGGQHDFTVLKQSQTLAVTDRILNLLTALIAGVAAISLLIGGIGIMNVMLVSITERMHEVGIRKAVGATNRQILGQFITEATVLSIVGALIGIVFSVAVAIALRVFTPLAPVVTWQVAIIACVVAIGVGVLFGSAPALKAARKDPIEALRNE